MFFLSTCFTAVTVDGVVVFLFCIAGISGWCHRAGVQGGVTAPRHLPEHGGLGEPTAQLQERRCLRGFLQLCQGEHLELNSLFCLSYYKTCFFAVYK